MPVAALKVLAKKAGVSMSSAEKKWDHAKKIVKDEYGKSEDDPSFWALTMGITKKMLGVSESLTFKEFILKELLVMILIFLRLIEITLFRF